MIRNLNRTALIFGSRRLFVPATSSSLLRSPLHFAPFSTGKTGKGCSPCEVGACIDKLGEILQEYRKANYAQTLPSRFVKEVVTAADANKDGVITADEIRGLLRNIGAADCMSQEELEVVVAEAGIDEEGGTGSVPVERVMEIMLEGAKPSVNAEES